jgi:hypothetical protein
LNESQLVKYCFAELKSTFFFSKDPISSLMLLLLCIKLALAIACSNPDECGPISPLPLLPSPRFNLDHYAREVIDAPDPEFLFYRFDSGTGASTIPNLATSPPAGTGTATYLGAANQIAGDLCPPGGSGGSFQGVR